MTKFKVEKEASGRFLLTWTNFQDREEWTKVLNSVRALPSRTFSPKTKGWSIPNNPKIVAMAQEIGFDFSAVGASTETPKKALVTIEKNLHLVPLDMAKVHPKAYPYQVDFLRFMEQRNGRGLLGDDMGTGKTLQSLMWAMYKDVYPCLIVVLAPTKIQWGRAWRQWHPEGHPQRNNIEILNGRTPETLRPGMNYIINWDILADWTGEFPTGMRGRIDGPLVHQGFQYLVGDEIQKIGNPTSKMSKAFRALGKRIPHLATLSGTPIRSRPRQFWPILNLLDQDTFPKQQQFLNRYCDPKSNGFSTTYDGSTHTMELHELIQPLMLRRMKKDVMTDLPAKTVEVIPLDVGKKELQGYTDQELTSLGQAKTKAAQKDAVSSLLRSAYELKEKAAFGWISDFLDTGSKLIVFCWHRTVVTSLVKGLSKYTPAQIDGGITGKKRDQMVERFRTNPKCRVLVANIQAGGVGLDGLQDACSHVAFIEFSHTPTDHAQAEDRLHRGGQILPVTAYYLVAPGTVDDDAIEVLDSRKATIGQLLDGEEATEMDMLTEILARRGM